MTTSFAIEHLLLRLLPLARQLRAAARRQTALSRRLSRPGLTALCVTPEQVETLIDELERPTTCTPDDVDGDGSLTTEEEVAEAALRARAVAAGAALPLDAIVERCGLTPFEERALLLCAAPEVDRAYERIYAYVLDDLNRRQPCVELLVSVGADSAAERVARLEQLDEYGRLRRYGLLEAIGTPATLLRQELRLTPAARAFLLGEPHEPAEQELMLRTFRDDAEVPLGAEGASHSGLDPEVASRIAAALSPTRSGSGGTVVVGLWGPRHAGRDDAVRGIARAAGRPLRLVVPGGAGQSDAPADVLATVTEATRAAAALGALLWVQLGASADEGRLVWEDAVAAALARGAAPVVMTARRPWRPSALLEGTTYVEAELRPPSYGERYALWSGAFPELPHARLDELAASFRLSATEIRTVERVARARALLDGDGGEPGPVAPHVDDACRAVTQHRAARFATLVEPRRGPDDLVLAPAMHRQVLDVAAFFRAWSRVGEQWGFDRGGGVKALFAGDPGTGKTLAAEVIAHQLGLPLLKVDLARVVSKWVGETEKNLESVFSEAEESHSVLFFDEADALFGKRGEVQHGTDRYANLEVSYLLQKLEEHYGLVILASNLRDQIDVAFTRRFHVVVHFPRPGIGERRRIWEMAFPARSPLDPTVDLDVLARLDLTGAGIATTAHTAALLAADAGEASIGVGRIVQAAARQFRREGRILAPSELGPYASLFREGV